MTEKHKKILKRKIYKMRHLWMFPAVFLYFEILLRILEGTGIFRGFFYMLFLTLGYGMLLGTAASFLPRRVNRKVTCAVLFGVGTLFVVECFIRESFQMYMTLPAILKGAGGVATGFSGELFRTIFSGIPTILLFLLPGILYLYAGERLMPIRSYRCSFLLVLLLVSVLVTSVGIFFSTHGGSKEKYERKFEFHTATETFGLLTGVRLSSKYAVFGNKEAETFILQEKKEEEKEKKAQEELVYPDHISELDFEELAKEETDPTVQSMHQYVNSLTPSAQNEYTGLFKGKNLILIAAEAFSDCVIREDLTPTLYRLSRNGFYFSDYYQPSWGGSTVTGEYSFLTGLVPMHQVETMQMTADNLNYYTLGNRLKQEGYKSAAFHNGNFDYYDRQLTHISLGYDSWMGYGNGLEKLAGAWPSDSEMIAATMDTYLNQAPFSIYYMTLSGHCTYKKDDVKVQENLEKVQEVLGTEELSDTTLYYYCYQMELEKALTVMVEKLEQTGLADDTVICLTSDHYPYGLAKSKTFGNTEDYVSDLYGYEYNHPWEKDHNAWILWSGCLENDRKDMAKEIPEPTYSLDIVPTLLNLFGVEYDSRLLVGRDVFSKEEPLVLWNNHSFVTSKGKYDASTGEFFPNKDEKVDEAYIEDIKNQVENKIKFSNQVLEKDYYKILFKKY